MFILPPSEEDVLARLRARKRESEEQIQQRFGHAKREIEAARACGVYDTFIINDERQRAIDEAVARVNEARQARRCV